MPPCLVLAMTSWPLISFSWNRDRSLFTFDYSTDSPHATNWIGIYASNGGPVNQVKPEASMKWAYAPNASGSITVPADSLAGGSYKAYFLARDGYKWLASPITVSVPGLSFPRGTATLRNAKVGVAYSASVGGLASFASASFTKVSGTGWVSVSASGVLTGTPTAAGSSVVTVRASGNGATADIVVTIPVRAAGDCLVQNVRVMTYNMWAGGSNMNNFHQKQLRALIEANVDIVGLQEADPHRAGALADSLGWHYWESAGNGRTAILSRYPISETYSHVGVSVAARVALDGGQQINVWSAHLTAYPYGPYEACNEGKSPQQVLAAETSSGRFGEMNAIVSAMKPQIAANGSVPVLLLGDFNAPSHLDWTPALQDKNCGYADIQWPTSRIPTDAGLIDSFRVANPDPAAVQGTTWSPIYPLSGGTSGRAEPQDRIDYIYHAGNVQVSGSKTFVIGKPSPVPGHANNEWTSDHAAVVTQYRLNSGTC
ncbi:endonuclease/exonuclease/phosphatase family [Plectosphaerella cucumerina]|uniref:Endonuclease/exonuclease/phosphatase family n=1 Tax=Plectosphaerella cucumerina TaxID=40658 RepID=A0A8K0TGY2_9PEZI|nr:endonuclease/exonuclease/phosphatase family [Plectosphaerella cucumerina]